MPILIMKWKSTIWFLYTCLSVPLHSYCMLTSLKGIFLFLNLVKQCEVTSEKITCYCNLLNNRLILPHNLHLRTFARKSSNIDFFLKLSPVLDYGLLMSKNNVKKLGGHRIRFGDMMFKRSPKIWEIWLRYCIRIECLFVQKVYK